MKDLKDICRVALIQAAPVMFDRAACVEKAVRLIREAAGRQPESAAARSLQRASAEERDQAAGERGADLIIFPELFIPGYPYGMTFGYTVGSRQEEGRKDWKMYYDNSILVPGPETDRLCEAAAAAGAWLSIGVSERDAVTGTLYNSNLIITPEGTIHSCHRKLKPTGAERLVWGDADRGYFPVAQTPWGPMGALICWESYMPLVRTALYQKGVSLYISPNTNDYEAWLCTARHIAMEGRCYFIHADLFFTRAMYPAGLHCPEEIEKLPDIVCRGGSCIIDPYGNYVTEPVWDREQIIRADLDMQKVPSSRMEFDPCGHYSRPDVLELRVNEK